MDTQAWLREQLKEANPDLLRSLLQTMVEGLMAAEVSVLCNAEYGERNADRENVRNGYRQRDWDTRLGSISLGIPKLRQGSYFPGWLLQPRRRVERAMVAVIAEAYLAGVSTRRVDGASRPPSGRLEQATVQGEPEGESQQHDHEDAAGLLGDEELPAQDDEHLRLAHRGPAPSAVAGPKSS